MKSELEKKIKSYFIDKSEVVAVYLFGSYAEGKERHLSDVDIGVLLDQKIRDFEKQKRNEYLIDLSRILRNDIHLVIINSASEDLMKQIYLKGKCILVKNARKLSEYNMVMLSKIADFSYYKNRMQTGFIKKIMKG